MNHHHFHVKLVSKFSDAKFWRRFNVGFKIGCGSDIDAVHNTEIKLWIHKNTDSECMYIKLPVWDLRFSWWWCSFRLNHCGHWFVEAYFLEKRAVSKTLASTNQSTWLFNSRTSTEVAYMIFSDQLCSHWFYVLSHLSRKLKFVQGTF
jgi:hypothetical protein